MSQQPTAPADVFSACEVARAAGVPPRLVAGLVRSGVIPTVDGRYVGTADAVRAVCQLRDGQSVSAVPALFVQLPAGRRAVAGPLAVSGLMHVAGLVLLFVLSALGVERPATLRETSAKVAPVRLVYLNLPGPGGGGGGGGLGQPQPAAAKLQGPTRTPSPVTIHLGRPASQSIPRVRPASQSIPPAPVEPTRKPGDAPPPPLPINPPPPVVAPLVSLGADGQDVAGLIEGASTEESEGPGKGDGIGTGEGTGLGEGTGPGIGPGSGGGAGGGPYRPGSGIEPPRLLREVKPRYTEMARRQGLEGEVVVEIVVQRDGRVGDVRVLQRLGAGLDDRAVEAVRQWRFEPARRLGSPVDVLVEVAVEFRLR
ncbi:MAG: energy transducer TonB [Chloroflexota bacterium]